MVTVKVAKTRKEIRDFVIFPTQLYKNDPYYVPDMVGDQINDLRTHLLYILVYAGYALQCAHAR